MSPRGKPTHPNTIRRRRIALNLRQIDTARHAGITRQAMNMIELQRVYPSVRVSLILAQLFECSLDELFPPPDWLTRTRPDSPDSA